ncbi:MAG: L,D-transpeptidase [Bdellovibrionota bacterium]
MKYFGNKSNGVLRVTASCCLFTLFLVTSACSKDKKESAEQSPHTGHEMIEAAVAPVSARISSDAKSGTIAYVYAERLRARSAPEVSESNLVGILDLNDQVAILEPNQIGAEKFVKVEIKQSKAFKPGDIVYVASSYLSNQKRSLKKAEAVVLKYFMVQNLATEKIRVYERCQPPQTCTNRMIFQADMVAGEDDDGTRTNVGIYRIERWEKFYEDGARKYPAWYRPHYPKVPNMGASRASWFDSDFMPNGKGDARGAFGWYTAIVGPNASAQWTHGTMGWGADHDEFITFKNGFVGNVVNLFAAIRSHGCTRVDNEAISYLRHLLPVGSTLVKIYAKEGLVGNLRDYSKHKPGWEYILTKKGYGKAGGQTADLKTIMAENTPTSEWIEQGQYFIDQYPKIEEGNVYDIDEDEFSGMFFVDEGTLNGYRHPKTLGRGGFKDQPFPNYMIFKM